MGHCWENEVFGGNVIRSLIPGEALKMCKWPNCSTRDNDGCRRVLRRTGYHGSYTYYIIPAYFLHTIQQQAYWDSHYPVDIISLRVQKFIGHRIWPGWGTWMDSEWRSQASSEGRFRADENAWVVRIETPDLVEKQYSQANRAAVTGWLMNLPEPAM